MAIWSMFKAKPVPADHATGHITDLRVEGNGERERWLFHLDSRPNDEFVFAPTALSPKRRRGDQVTIAFGRPDAGGPLPVEHISAS